MNWDAIEREAVDLLSEYLRIDTTNPPGNERRAVEFLGRFLEKEGLEVRYLGKTPERMNLICRKPSGSDRRGLMLLHHCDVVGAREEEWSHPPFGGLVRDGYVWGRGALDMKGMGVMELMAFILAHRQRLPLKKDLLLVVTCDEESGSANGAGYLAENHPKEVESAWALNEGGIGVKMGERSAIQCGFGEKGPLWVRLTARGRSGHGSVPHGENPCDLLLEALRSLMAIPRTFRVIPELKGFLEGLGLNGLGPKELESHPLFRIPALRAMFQDTMCLTMLRAGSRANVIPDEAEATLDLRILPDRSTQEAFDELLSAVPGGGACHLEKIMAIEASCSPPNDALFRCLQKVSERHFPGSAFLPSICTGFTDSRCFRRLGTACFGLIPVLVEMDDAARAHGRDERIPVSELVRGIRVMWDVVREICGA